MSKVVINETTLTNIGAAIREKTGKTDLIAPGDMPTEIRGIETGGGGLDEENLIITGNCSYRLANNGWNWFVVKYGDKITTNNISSMENMFAGSTQLENIPFDLVGNGSDVKLTTMFSSCSALKEIGKIKNCKPIGLQSVFAFCEQLTAVPEFVDCDFSSLHNGAATAYCGNNMFSGCYSLRSIPETLVKQIYNSKLTSTYYGIFRQGFSQCYALDEVRGIMPLTGTATSNLFYNMVNECSRAKNIVFATQEDGTPYAANWKKQVFDLTVSIGYGTHHATFTSHNSGITVDKEVKDDATYQALKNDPDWFTCDIAYSRYNHDSAVTTINSLPDCSASGDINTIKFKGASGSKTDGGAINTLTEEEIAVAAAKGWTVSFA